MAIAFRANALGNNGQSATSTTVTFVVPASAVVGDFAIAHFSGASSTLTVTPQTAWNLRRGPDASGSVNEVWCYYKTLTGNPGALATEAGTTVTFTISSLAKCVGILDVFSGVDPLFPFDADISSNTAVANTIMTAPNVTNTQTNALIYEIFSGRVAAATNTIGTLSAALTGTGFSASNYAALPNLHMQGAYQTALVTTPGSKGGDTATYVNSMSNMVTNTYSLRAKQSLAVNNYQFMKVGDGMSVSEKIR